MKPVSAKQLPASVDVIDDPAAPQKPANKKKRKIVGGAAALLLLGGGGGAYAMLSGDSKAEAHGEAPAEEADAAEGEGGHGGEGGAKFVDVPPMVINLRSADGAARFIKLHFMLVPGPKGTEEKLKEQLPLLLDAYQPFLRELRPEDLAGSAAVFRIKEELVVRATGALGAGQVKDVLIQDLIQQ